jgi:hypothetical protein
MSTNNNRKQNKKRKGQAKRGDDEPTPKEVVTSLCPPVEEDTKTLYDPVDQVPHHEQWLKTACPKPGCENCLTWKKKT